MQNRLNGLKQALPSTSSVQKIKFHKKIMGEDKHTEWKESWRDEHLKWICGFANAQGGVLEIGRDDKGKAVGVKNVSRLLEVLPNKIKHILGIVPEDDNSLSESWSL